MSSVTICLLPFWVKSRCVGGQGTWDAAPPKSDEHRKRAGTFPRWCRNRPTPAIRGAFRGRERSLLDADYVGAERPLTEGGW